MSDRETTIHNERSKLTATWLNGIAIATFALAALAPPLTVMYGDRPLEGDVLIGFFICILLSAAIHLFASYSERHALMTFEGLLVYIMPAVAALVLAVIAVVWQGHVTRRFDEARRKRDSARDASA